MQAVEITATCLLFGFICLQIALFISLVNIDLNKPTFYAKEPLLPVSILIPARNEAANIIACLKSIEKLNYPTDKYEVLIGNDQSTDETAGLVATFIADKPNFKLINIDKNLGKARAKANVLAHLIHESKNDIIFVTDADIVVKPGWINSLLPYFENEKVGIVSGSTVVQAKNWFGQLQGIDWLYFSGLLIAFDKLGLKSTAVGNNMAFTKQAYLATGGYEKFDFSVTEDFKLFTQIRAKGYESVNIMEAKSLNISKPQAQLVPFLHQRKRWLIGAKELPFIWQTIFALLASFYPLLIVLFIFNTKNALALWICKLALQTIVILFLSYRVKYKLHWRAFFSFELYSIANTFSTMVFFVLPVKMIWKQRTY